MASYKKQPSVCLPMAFPPLFPGACRKCSPLHEITSVDPISEILGRADLGKCGVGSNLVHELVLRYYQRQYSGGVSISPGQLEVVGRAGQGMVVLLLPDRQLSSSDLALLCLALALPVKLPAPLPPALVPGLGNSWTDWLLVKAGLASPYYHVDQLRSREVRGLRGLVISSFDSRLVMSLKERQMEVLLVSVLLSHEADGGSRRVRVEVGRPMSLEMMSAGGWTMEDISRHLTVTTRRMSRVSPAQLVAFVLQTGHCPRQPSVASLREAIRDLLELIRMKRPEVKEMMEQVDIVRCGVSQLEGHIDKNDFVHITKSDVELWRLSCAVEEMLLAECLLSLAVLGMVRPGASVKQHELLERAETLARLIGLQASSLPPCESLHQLVFSGLESLQLLDCLCPVKVSPVSQHGVRPGRQSYMYRADQQGEDREVTLASLAVGETAKEIRLLTWLGGVLRYRLTNLAYTTRALLVVKEVKLVGLEEIVDLVREEIENKRGRGWKLSEKSSVASVTRDSVKALALAEVVTIIDKPGLQLVELTQTFNFSLNLQGMINLVLEF